MNEQEQLYHEIGGSFEGSERGQMFGKPCYKFNGKTFISFYQNEMVFKLEGDDLVEALALSNSKLFDPSQKGRPMKEWVQVSHANAHEWKKLGKAAFEYSIKPA